jgi:hypothetical protein
MTLAEVTVACFPFLVLAQVIPCLQQSKNIVLPNLLPGKLFQAAIYPIVHSGKETKVPAKIELKSTCGCPVDEETLRQTEMTGMPTEIALTQVRQ